MEMSDVWVLELLLKSCTPGWLPTATGRVLAPHACLGLVWALLCVEEGSCEAQEPLARGALPSDGHEAGDAKHRARLLHTHMPAIELVAGPHACPRCCRCANRHGAPLAPVEVLPLEPPARLLLETEQDALPIVLDMKLPPPAKKRLLVMGAQLEVIWNDRRGIHRKVVARRQELAVCPPGVL